MVVNGSNQLSSGLSANVTSPAPVDERALRRYTPEEDERILREWWQKEKRPQLIRDLGRTKAALAQRYYLLLREMGVTPEEHRRQQLQAEIRMEGGKPNLHSRAGAILAARNTANLEGWTPEREAFLWRQARSGTSFEEIAEILGGVTPGECRARYLQMLEQPPETVAEGADRADRADRADTEDSSSSESTESESELWTTLAALPERLDRLEAEQERLAQRIALLEGSWAGLVTGLQEIARVLSAAAGVSADTGHRQVQPSAETIAPVVRELGRSLQAFLRLGHWDKIRQLPAFLASLDEKLKQLEEWITAP